MYELNVKNELNTTFDHTSSTRDSLMICFCLLHLVVLLARIHICQLRGRDNYTQDSSFSKGKRRATLGGIQTHDTVISVSALPTEVPGQLNRFISSTQYNTKSIQSSIYTEIHCPTLALFFATFYSSLLLLTFLQT